MSGIWVTTFCNKAHRLSDGKPIKHECFIIPPKLLKAERDNDPHASALWSRWSFGHRTVSRGVSSKTRAHRGSR